MTVDLVNMIERIDRNIKDLENPDVEARRKAAGELQYAVCGRISRDLTEKIIHAAAKRLDVIVNGHEVLVEPDPYVREMCVDCFRLAAEDHTSIAKYVPMLERVRDKDPHCDELGHWVRERAADALATHGKIFGLKSDPLPVPARFTTRPHHLEIAGKPRATSATSSG